MKRFALLLTMAVAFVAVGFSTAFAEKLESRFLTIGGKTHVVTEKVSDNNRKVVSVVEVAKPEKASKKHVSTKALQTTKAKEAKMNFISTAAASIIAVQKNNVMQKTPSQATKISEMKTAKLAKGTNAASQYLEPAKQFGQKSVERNIAPKTSVHVHAKSADVKNTLEKKPGSTQTGYIYSKPQELESPKQSGQEEMTKYSEKSKQLGQNTIITKDNNSETVGRGFVRLPQDPQDEEDLKSWMVVGNKLLKIDPATGYSMEKPIPWGYRILYHPKRGNCEVIMVKEAALPAGYELLKKENKS